MNEKISIIMGIYNCEETLEQSIDSILAQTYTNWELILCDDCSKDNTYAVAEKYQKQYPEKIILIRNQTNKKLSYTLNHCLQYATGKYVARMDGDDISVPERLEEQITFLKEHQEYDLVGTLMQRFDDNGFADVVPKIEYPDKFFLLKASPFNHATILTYKSVYDELGGYCVESRAERCEDFDLWFRFFNKGFKGYNIQKPLYLVREDINAIRRRTIKNRLKALKTRKVGYALLGFPKKLYYKEALKTYVKCLTPSWLMLKYRKRQKAKYLKNQKVK